MRIFCVLLSVLIIGTSWETHLQVYDGVFLEHHTVKKNPVEKKSEETVYQISEYKKLSSEHFCDMQHYIDKGYIIRYRNYFAGHNPGAFSYINKIKIGDKVTVNGKAYTCIDYTSYKSGAYFEDAWIHGLNLWDDIMYTKNNYIAIQFCKNGMMQLYLCEK